MILGLLTDTVNITDADGVAVATAEACRMQERIAQRQIVVLDGMLSDDQPQPRITFVFGPAAAVLEHYRLSGLAHNDGDTDARRFEVQTVIVARGPAGPVFTTAYCKVA